MMARIFLFCVLLTWTRSELNNSNVDKLNGVQKKEINFSEGGAVQISHNKLAENNLLNVNGSNEFVNLSLLDDDGTPSGISSIKPRKGVHHQLIVARKGAPPCPDSTSSDNGCAPQLSSEIESKMTSPSMLVESDDISSTPFMGRTNLTAATVSNLRDDSLMHSKIHKPTVTLVPDNSDIMAELLKSDRNVVIPVAALVCAPLIVLLLLLVYKRYRESRDNLHYERMGFLIEDIYND